MSEHLDLDALADALADPGADSATAGHLAACASCRARRDELEAALPAVTAALAAAPAPTPPPDLEARLVAALQHERTQGTADVLPLDGPRRRRVPLVAALTAAAAAAAVSVGALVVTQQHGSHPTQSAARSTGYRVNDSGNDYTKASLVQALPGLLAGSVSHGTGAASGAAPVPSPLSANGTPARASAPQSLAAADPLAALRTTSGLATCLASLTDPQQSGLPLALDYASYEGHPALVVVLPSTKPGKLDVLVVPPGCAHADGSLLYFTRVPRP